MVSNSTGVRRLNRPGFDRGSGDGISTRGWLVRCAAEDLGPRFGGGPDDQVVRHQRLPHRVNASYNVERVSRRTTNLLS